MNVDLRGFHYPLQVLRDRRQWELAGDQARLAKLVQEIHQSQNEVAELMAKTQAQSLVLTCESGASLDPTRRSTALRWLVWAGEQVKVAQRRVDELLVQQLGLRQRCRQLQLQLEVLDRHRGECLDDFIREGAGRQATDADRDWLARRASVSESSHISTEAAG